MENINHKNFYEKHKKLAEEKLAKEEKEVEELVEEPKEETLIAEEIVGTVENTDEEETRIVEEEYFYSLTKSEQIEKLKSFGLSAKKIKTLKYEQDRVEKLLELTRE